MFPSFEGNVFVGLIRVHALDHLVPVHLVPVELRAVDTGELGFAADGHAAAAAHARAVDHY